MPSEEKPHRKIIWQDLFVLLAILFNMAAYVISVYEVNTIQALTQTQNTNIEANPAAKGLLSLTYTAFAIRITMFAILLAFYLLLRSKRQDDTFDMWIFNAATMFIFLFFTYDFLNDAAILLHFL